MPARTVLQLDDMNEPLRNSLWNFVLERFFDANSGAQFDTIARVLAVDFFKVPLHHVPLGYQGRARTWLAECFSALQWYGVYDLVEFLVRRSRDDSLVAMANRILEEEHSGYRFVAGQLAPISGSAEIAAIEDARQAARTAGLNGVQIHIDAAVALLAHRPPDYRNSVKESILAVESAARQLSGTGGLKEALMALEGKVTLHPAMKAGFLNLYGYTSDDDGIRHAILEAPTVGFDEAKFMLVSCSAFATFLVSKAGAAGLIRP